MLRMNRQNPSKPKNQVKHHCANYNTGFICSGAMINRQGKMWLDKDKANKPCLVAKGKECDYFETIVKRCIK